jgi:hypothetical protein
MECPPTLRKKHNMRLSAAVLALTLSAPLWATQPVMHDHEPITRPVPGQTTPMAAPEIDVAAAPGALTLLAGSLAIYLGRRARRKSRTDV